MDVDAWVIVTFVVGVFSSILSGMSGGGGGFIVIPYYLLVLGLPPAQALATAKMGGIGTSVGAISAFKGKGLVNKKLAVPFMTITFVFAIISAWLIPQLDPVLFQKIIGVVLIVLTPTLFINKGMFTPGDRSKGWIVAGYIAFAIFSFMQTLVGTGMGTMVVLVLMYLFGLNALQANATKRVSQSVQAVVLFVLLSIQGLVMWWHGIAGLIGAWVGSHIGAHIAIKRGSDFVKVSLAIVMVISGAALLIW